MTASDKAISVLVVEDDLNMKKILAVTLIRAGYRVIEAANGRWALEVLKGNPTVDLIISDIMMPEMDGFAFRDRLISDPSTRDIPFLFLSARTMPEDQVKGLRTGVDDYVTKPFDPPILLARVEAVLERRRQLALLARRDALTGLLNRYSLEEKIKKELQRLNRTAGKASMIFLDIDDFKLINDAHGHSFGDQVLLQLADLLREHTRKTDVVGRFGGEEFVVLLAEADQETASDTVQRLLARFRDSAIGPTEIRKTFSAGIVETPRDGTDYATLVARADAAMYTAKRAGKAGVVAYRDGEAEALLLAKNL